MPVTPFSPGPGQAAKQGSAKDRLIAAIVKALPVPPKQIAVAVSGGSDSLALLFGVHAAFREKDVKISVATVNHGLRPEAKQEAEQVARFAAPLGLDHSTLNWEAPCDTGNLQGQARAARFDLLSTWARERKIPMVALGHTADDQAETVLMRLRREAGVTGLAGIPERRTFAGVDFIRPLLGVRREELRDVLRDEGVHWIDDPSNENEQFERVRTRKALAVLEDLGVPATAFSTVAENMSQACKALEWYSFISAKEVLEVRCGAVAISRRAFRVLPVEIAHRLLAAAIRWLSGQDYVPRRKAMIDARTVVKHGGGYTLGGCRIISDGETAWLFRELNAVQRLRAAPGQLWDGRWVVYGMDTAANQVKALGDDGLRQHPSWRENCCPREVLQSTPGVWNGDELVAAPAAGYENGWSATLTRCDEALYTSFLTH